MDFLSTQRQTMNQWLSDAEATQHRLAKQQLELEERQRQLDNFEKVVRQREREVLQAEAAASLAKRDETSMIKRSMLAPSGPKRVTDEMLADMLIREARPIFVIPHEPYGPERVESIKKHDLRVTTAIVFSSEKTTLRFRMDIKGKEEIMELDVSPIIDRQVPGGHIEMTLKPIDDEWIAFVATSMRVGVQYPMPTTRVRRATAGQKKLPPSQYIANAP